MTTNDPFVISECNKIFWALRKLHVDRSNSNRAYLSWLSATADCDEVKDLSKMRKRYEDHFASLHSEAYERLQAELMASGDEDVITAAVAKFRNEDRRDIREALSPAYKALDSFYNFLSPLNKLFTSKN